ncbi:hypothetical protein VTO73DRAFT_353 [Trametes versicolor]
MPTRRLTDVAHRQPTEFELRKRNSQFAEKARAGKNPIKPSRQDRLSKRSPVSIWALGIILFVVLGGVIFELLRLFFL